MNKLQGYETSFDGWKKWGDICVISPQSQNYFLLCFFLLYISQWDERRRDKFLSLSLPLPISSLHLHVHLLQAFFLLEIFAAHHSSWLEGVFLVFLHLFTYFLWMVFDEGCYISLEMFYCHEFMFNWDGISRFEAVFWYVWKNREVQKTKHPEHAWVLNFLGLIQMCLHFYDIFFYR